MVEAENVAPKHPFQERINYQGGLTPLLQNVCGSFGIGEYQALEVIPAGYEDFNLAMQTDRGKFFVKIFASSRSGEDCDRYVEIINKVVQAGVSHPRLLGPLFQASIDDKKDRLCVMEFVEGQTFFDLRELPTQEEQQQIIEQAALINQINLKPTPLYDSWAVTSFPREYESKSQHLNPEDKPFVDASLQEFRTVDLIQLPHAFVHGDIIETNVMRGADGKIWILDFAVANYYPRIQEFAVVISHLLFDADPQTFRENYKRALEQYQEHIPLTEEEIKALDIFIRAAFAMELLSSNFEKKVKNNNSAENEHFLELGRIGLRNHNS